MSYPKISIVTPSFNQGNFLEQTIQSVLDQNYPNLEYIVIDGGSTDKSVEIIKKYEKHLAYWISERDNGQSDAINKGLNKCTGNIFNWLNSDDYYSGEILFTVADEFAKGADVVTGRIRLHNEDGNDSLTFLFPPDHRIIDVIASSVYVQQCTFFRTDFINEIKGVNPLLHYSMDLELWLKYLLMNGMSKVVYNENIIADFRVHGNSKTFLSNENFFNEWLKIYTGIKAFYDGNIGERYKRILGDYRFNVPRILLDSNSIESALSNFFHKASITIYGQRNFELFDLIAELIDETRLNIKKRE